MLKKSVTFLLMFLLSFILIACSNHNVEDSSIDNSNNPNGQAMEENNPDLEVSQRYFPIDLTQERFSSNNNVYSLSAYLDDETSKLYLSGGIYYKNDDFDLEEIYLTIYPNAFNPTSNEHNVDIEYIRINGKSYNFTITGPDYSQVYIDLDFALNKGDRAMIEFSYSFDFWDNYEVISEYSDEYIALWFYPFVAVYDSDGWNTHGYAFEGESYYNTIGDYYVEINTPIDFKVAASGKLEDSVSGIERVKRTYKILNARDFSFSTSENYSYYEKNIDGRTYSIYSTKKIDYISKQEEIFEIATDVFNFLEEHLGPYPYDHFTIQFGNLNLKTSTGLTYNTTVDLCEECIVRSIIQQWFYSMVGNNQYDEAFLDESITSYLVAVYYYDKYSMRTYQEFFDFYDSTQPLYQEEYQISLGKSLLQRTDEYGSLYSYIFIFHGPSMLSYYVDQFLDGDVMGFVDILRVYFETYKYDIAHVEDLLDIIDYESNVENSKEWFTMQINEFQDFDNRP